MQWITNILLISSLTGILATAQSSDNVSLPTKSETTESFTNNLNQSTKYEDTTQSQIVEVKTEEISIISSTGNALFVDEGASTITVTESTLNDSTIKSLLKSDTDKQMSVLNTSSEHVDDLNVKPSQNQSIDGERPENSSDSSSPHVSTQYDSPIENSTEDLKNIRHNASSEQIVSPTSDVGDKEASTISGDKTSHLNVTSEEPSHVAVKRHISEDSHTTTEDIDTTLVATTENSTISDVLSTTILNETLDVAQNDTRSTEVTTNSKLLQERTTLESDPKSTCYENNSTNITDSSPYSHSISTIPNDIVSIPVTSSDDSLTTNVPDSNSTDEKRIKIIENVIISSTHKPLSRGQRSSEFNPSEIRLPLNSSVKEPFFEETPNSVVIVNATLPESSEFQLNTEVSSNEQSPAATRPFYPTDYSSSTGILVASTEINKQVTSGADNITDSYVYLESTEIDAPKSTETIIPTLRTTANTSTDMELTHSSIQTVNSSHVMQPVPIEKAASRMKDNSEVSSPRTTDVPNLQTDPDVLSSESIPYIKEVQPTALENSPRSVGNGSAMANEMEMMNDSPSGMLEREGPITSDEKESPSSGLEMEGPVKFDEMKPEKEILRDVQNSTPDSQLSTVHSDGAKHSNLSAEHLPTVNKFHASTTEVADVANEKNMPLDEVQQSVHSVVTKDDTAHPTEIIRPETSENVIKPSVNDTIVVLKASGDDESPISAHNNVLAEGQTSNNESFATDKVMLRENAIESSSPEPKSIEVANVTDELENQTAAAVLPSSSTVATTTKTSYRIRKPKVRLDGDSDNASAVIRRPTTTTRKPIIKTGGRPVSIFSRNKTRINSITSSTTPGSTTARNFQRLVNQVSGGLRIAGTEVFSMSLLPLTTPATTTTTEAEEEEEEEEVVELLEEHAPHQNQSPTFNDDDDVTLIKIAAATVVNKGLRWKKQLNTRTSPQFIEQKQRMHKALERILRVSAVGGNLWKLEIDGFIETYPGSRSVVVDYSVYFVKTHDPIDEPLLVRAFNERLVNNSFWRYTFDPAYTQFEILHEEKLNEPTEPPETEPPIPQWAIAVIVIGAASFIFIVLFAAVTVYGRHHMRRRYASKLDDDLERSVDSKEWEKKLSGAAAYENLAADVVYDADDSGVDNVKRPYYME